MASPARLKGYGTTLGYATTLGGLASPTVVSGNTKIKMASLKRAETKTYDLLTVGTVTSQAQVKTSQGGWIDCDSWEITGYFTQTQYANLLSLFENADEVYWEATLPLAVGQVSVGTAFQVPGYVSEISIDEINVEDENLVMVPFKIKCNDVPNIVDGS